MLRERIADDIYVFTSELYLEATAGAVVTDQGAVVIDTLPFPEETRRMRDFVQRQCPAGIRYLIITHTHGDHSYGSYLFPEAEMIAQERCWGTLHTLGSNGLKRAQQSTPELAEVTIRLPPMVFEEALTIRLGSKTIRAMHSPGHARELAVVYVKEDRVLFGSDTVLPVPYIVDGSPQALARSLNVLRKLPVEAIVQGHGRVLLRGEVQEALDTSIEYLQAIERIAQEKAQSGAPRSDLLATDIESCGRSRIPLDGMVQRLHHANLLHLYDLYRARMAVAR